jgi:hypothetical protein
MERFKKLETFIIYFFCISCATSNALMQASGALIIGYGILNLFYSERRQKLMEFYQLLFKSKWCCGTSNLLW